MNVHVPVCYNPKSAMLGGIEINHPLRRGEHISIIILTLDGRTSLGWGKWWGREVGGKDHFVTDAGIPYSAPKSHQALIWSIIHQQNLFWGYPLS